VSLLVTAAALAELCGAPPEPVAAPDLADSAAYTAVGDAAGVSDPRTAVIAYRKAVALDAANERARAGLAAVCAAPIAAADTSALLDAIARYRAGDRAAARATLNALVASRPGPEPGAHFFLGLIALDRHDGRSAIRELELACSDPTYRALAAAPLRLAHRDGALALTLVVAPELDTNPQLLPDTPPSGAATGAPQLDADLLTAAAVTMRPWPWLAVRNSLVWRNQRKLSALDFVGEDIQVAAEAVEGPDRVALRYDVDGDLLDGARYLLANRAGLAVRHDARGVALVADYALRRRDYAAAEQQPFTGWVHAAEVGAVIHLGHRVDLDARLTGGREVTTEATFANSSGGIALAMRTRTTSPIRLAAGATASYQRYDAAQPDGLLRRDVKVEASVDLELDLGDHVIGFADANAARNTSTIEDFRYAKLSVRCGVELAFGAL
jgi:hypothetical protein